MPETSQHCVSFACIKFLPPSPLRYSIPRLISFVSLHIPLSVQGVLFSLSINCAYSERVRDLSLLNHHELGAHARYHKQGILGPDLWKFSS